MILADYIEKRHYCLFKLMTNLAHKDGKAILELKDLPVHKDRKAILELKDLPGQVVVNAVYQV
ncbi:hypothetical protein K2F40_16285 [Clostridium sp. CM028]|uniref:hypothetical protein n=1 Tax=unclassified Clostridium TaxID=2614128 RepID=UPI001C6E57F6|nr:MULTISPECIES: hypothetical protein [unclassified Clostridium]MBW9147110.1 hypothetical protein [Clostridium sp. CM027]MBW9150503.1 hypothetical protein [Clostridium sp. CM028]UVE42223.1 hypothetical protein KTC92_07220 [Clostridium sp. CM027]WLC62811.1 hypothetical protein KTC94_06020 [Clostridium sp. CM028]